MEAFNPFKTKAVTGEVLAPGSAKMTGPEILLKNLGLGEVLEAAKMLASSDTIGKILLFADQLPELNRKLDILVLAELKRQGVEINADGGAGPGANASEGTIFRADAEPDAGPERRLGTSDGSVAELLAGNEPDSGPGTLELARRDDDARDGGDHGGTGDASGGSVEVEPPAAAPPRSGGRFIKRETANG